MKEVKQDTSMVVTSKVLMTSVKVQTLVTLMVLTIRVLTGQDSGEVNQRYTLGGAGTARTDAIQNYVESHMGMLWHNVTDDFRLIAEGSYSEAHWYGAGSQESWRFCWCVLFLVEFLPVIYYTLKGGFLTFPFLL